jgi:hypothetical protein
LDLNLHIGTEKTGTTSLQKFMAANRRLLSEEGVVYPESPGTDNHIALATLARRSRTELWDQLRIDDREQWEAFRREFRQKFSAELAGHSNQTVVMSGEHCSSRLRTDEEVHRLLEFLDGFFDRITVVVYLRRQDDFLTSTYSTDVKNGGTQPLRIPDEATITFRYDYWELLSRWGRVFGRENMVVRRYGKAFLANGNLVDDFLGLIGLGPRHDLQRPEVLNESLDAECVEFLRIMNQRLTPSEQRRGIVAALQALSKGPLIDLPPPDLAAFMGQLAESNRRVALEYFDGDVSTAGDPLFGERRDGRPRTPAPQLSVDRAVGIAADVYAQLRIGGAKLHRPDPSELAPS